MDWGFNVERVLPSRNETVRLHNASAGQARHIPCRYGRVERHLERRPGVGAATATWHATSLQRRENDQQGGSNLDASLDAFYQVTPSLTAALTLNPDFADAQADEREVNLTRFELFPA